MRLGAQLCLVHLLSKLFHHSLCSGNSPHPDSLYPHSFYQLPSTISSLQRLGSGHHFSIFLNINLLRTHLCLWHYSLPCSHFNSTLPETGLLPTSLVLTFGWITGLLGQGLSPALWLLSAWVPEKGWWRLEDGGEKLGWLSCAPEVCGKTQATN